MIAQRTVFETWDEYLKKELIPHKYAVILLVALGILTTIGMMFAYPPADGADGMDYYLYAAYMLGADLPAEIRNVSPMFPLLLAITYIPFESFMIMVLLQAFFSVIFGLTYYLALRPYSPSLALVIGLIILWDAQVRVTFSLLATEPLYIILLAVAYLLALRPRKEGAHWFTISDLLLAITLFLLIQTRTVGILLSVPILALYIVQRRQWRLFVGIVTMIVVTLGAFQFLSTQSEIQQIESFNRNMYARIFSIYDLLDAENGEVSAQLANIQATCRQQSELRFANCVEIQAGGFNALSSLRESALIETFANKPFEVAIIIARHLVQYLTGTGHQFITPQANPATAQCESPLSDRADRTIEFFIEREWQAIELSDNQEQTLVMYVNNFVAEMCPPLTSNYGVRQYVYNVAKFYNLFALSYPYVWGVLLTTAISVIKPLRKLWFPISLAAVIWLYHASISAVLVNVQPRYIVVTNPFRIIVVCIFILACTISMHTLIVFIRTRLLDYFTRIS